MLYLGGILKYAIGLWVFLLMGFPVLTYSASTSRTLAPGWNLVSIPLSQESTEIIPFLAQQGISDQVTKIWSYDRSWKQYTPGGNSQLTHFEQNRGYWFLMDTEATLTLDLAQVSTRALSVSAEGWALASFNQPLRLDLNTEVFTPENFDSAHGVENIAKVWGYSKNWKSWDSSNSGSALTAISPFYAYWFLIGSSVAKTVPPTMTITPTGASSLDPVLAFTLPEYSLSVGSTAVLTLAVQGSIAEVNILIFRILSSSNHVDIDGIQPVGPWLGVAPHILTRTETNQTQISGFIPKSPNTLSGDNLSFYEVTVSATSAGTTTFSLAVDHLVTPSGSPIQIQTGKGAQIHVR
jgi:hypothetical protein